MKYNFDKRQDETPFKHLVRVSIDKINKLHNKDWTDIKEEFNFEHSSDHLRKLAQGWKMLDDHEESETMANAKEDVKYKETTEIMNDGSYKSDKLISMSDEDSKDAKYLLEAHGFNSDDWEITNARNSMWNANSKKNGLQTLFSSKITVKPKNGRFNMEKLLESIGRRTNPILVNREKKESERLLEIPLFDMHFGIADLAYYKETYDKVVGKIQSKDWDTILLIAGQDLIHTDGFTGQTTKGTMIEPIDTEQAWQDADDFYTGLIKESLSNSNNVEVIYSDGNHDQGISFGFVKMLEAKFPQAKFDSTMKTRKVFTWNDICLIFFHGNVGKNRIQKTSYSEFGKEIANSKLAEIHSGHYHSQAVKDDFGLVMRTLATKAITDTWHKEQGFIGSYKAFQLFEFSPENLEAIYYV